MCEPLGSWARKRSVKRSELGRDSALLTGSGCYLEHFKEQESRAPVHLSPGCFAYLSQILYHYPFLMGQSKVQCTSLSWNFRSPNIRRIFLGRRGLLGSQPKGNLVWIIFCKGKDIMITMPNAQRCGIQGIQLQRALNCTRWQKPKEAQQYLNP